MFFYNKLERVRSGHGSNRLFEGFYSKISKDHPDHTLILSIQASEDHHCNPKWTYSVASFDGIPLYQEWEIAVLYKGPSIVGKGMVFVNTFHRLIDLEKEKCFFTGDNVFSNLPTETVQYLYEVFSSLKIDDLMSLLDSDNFWGPNGKETISYRTEKAMKKEQQKENQNVNI